MGHKSKVRKERRATQKDTDAAIAEDGRYSIIRNGFKACNSLEQQEMHYRPIDPLSPVRFTEEQLVVRLAVAKKLQAGYVATLFPDSKEAFNLALELYPWYGWYTYQDGQTPSQNSSALRISEIFLSSTGQVMVRVHIARPRNIFYTMPSMFPVERLQRVLAWSPSQLETIQSCTQPGFFLDPCAFYTILEPNLQKYSEDKARDTLREREFKLIQANLLKDKKLERRRVKQQAKLAAALVVTHKAEADLVELLGYWETDGLGEGPFEALREELDRIGALLSVGSSAALDYASLTGQTLEELSVQLDQLCQTRADRALEKQRETEDYEAHLQVQLAAEAKAREARALFEAEREAEQKLLEAAVLAAMKQDEEEALALKIEEEKQANLLKEAKETEAKILKEKTAARTKKRREQRARTDKKTLTAYRLLARIYEEDTDEERKAAYLRQAQANQYSGDFYEGYKIYRAASEAAANIHPSS